jgi:hypothetical protein
MSPSELIPATAALEDDQAATAVTSFVDPPAVVPVAENCSVSPTSTVGLAGEIVIETTVSGETKKLPPQAPTERTRAKTQHVRQCE